MFFYLLYLFTFSQWNTIQYILKHDKTDTRLREKANQLIYDEYKNWAVKKARDFKKFHQYKCRTISTEELSLYSKLGLYNAIQHYKPGNYSFTRYASYYVDGQLYKGLTDLQPMTIIPKYWRMHPAHRKLDRFAYKSSLSPKMIGDEQWFFDKKNSNNHFDENESNRYYSRTWKKIYQMEPKIIRIFESKYSFDFKVLRSNREIGHLMAYSEENVRKYIQKGKENLLKEETE